MLTTGGEAAYTTLRGRILSGELPANATLREQALAEDLGVSRTPIREALRRLDEAGLVEFVPNRGATVVEWTVAEMRETYFVRATLESRAAGLAALHIGADALAHLANLIERMEPLVRSTEPAGVRELGHLNGQFHRTVVVASQSKQLLSLTESVSRVPEMGRTFTRFGGEFRARSNHHHRDILTALSSGDALWAEIAMRSHILAARNAVSRTIGAEATGAEAAG